MLIKQEKERRKVQISGKSSCIVALPKKWVREMSLGQGSEVTITKLSASTLLVNAQLDLNQEAAAGHPLRQAQTTRRRRYTGR
jgi:phosphate uptake regulator